MTTIDSTARRDFLAQFGAGIVITWAGAGPAAQAQPHFDYPLDPNAYLAIGADGRVTVFSPKIEMGQGVLTSQAQMVADELGVALADIDMVLGDTARCTPDMGTFGSLTTRMFGPALRAAAARARQALLDLGAQRLGVDAQGLQVAEGAVSVVGDPARRLSFAQLAGGTRIVEQLPGDAVLRSAVQKRVMGTSPHRMDALDKVTGVARFAADLRVPGMLYACVLRPPVHGARLHSVDTAGAARQPGVLVVNRDGLVATLHANPEAAAVALAAVQAQWDAPPAGADRDSIREHLLAMAGNPREVLRRGDPAAAAAHAQPVLRAQFRKGYVAHAAMETHAALAQLVDGQLTVWASTQTPFPTRDRVARAVGMDPAKVRVITPPLGGGFGGKSADAQAMEAARLASITGRPVQVAWSRGEEFFLDTFDPASVVVAETGLTAQGRISHWDSLVVAAGERGAIPVYDIPDVSVRVAGGVSYGAGGPPAGMHPFAVGPWRGPGASMNVFAIESQVDQLAAAARVDPLEFRLRHATEPRLRHVLQEAAKRFGWTPAAAPSGRGVGIACSLDAGTFVATIAQVRVDAASGAVRVVRLVCVQDMGLVVNPEGARMQMEGGLTMGLGYALAEELDFSGGDVRDRNFDTYAIPRFSWVPAIETFLMPNDGLPPQGGGEPAITTVGGALANAVFDACRARLMRLPMTPDRVRAAIEALAAA